jgi:hypothetical protein
MAAQANLFEEAEMAETETGMGAVVSALERLSDKLDEAFETQRSGTKRGRRRDREREEDGPESARDGRGRGELGEIRGVLFPVSIPLGRSGETLSCYLLTGPVRDERDLLDLAEEVDRGEFRRVLRVYQPKRQYNDNRNGNGNYGGGGYDRGRGYDRDRR